MVNWKRGITRLYVVFWALWALVLLMRATPMFLMGNSWSAVIILVAFGIFVPACVLLGIRWAIDGFGALR